MFWEEIHEMSDVNCNFLQDGICAHTSKATSEYLVEYNLNVLDFSVWSDLETHVWRLKPTDLNVLKKAMDEECISDAHQMHIKCTSTNAYQQSYRYF